MGWKSGSKDKPLFPLNLDARLVLTRSTFSHCLRVKVKENLEILSSLNPLRYLPPLTLQDTL